jgi:hypothetical protein
MCYSENQIFSALFAEIDSTYRRTATKPTMTALPHPAGRRRDLLRRRLGCGAVDAQAFEP